MKKILVFMFLFVCFIHPPAPRLHSVVVLDGDVIIGNALPKYAQVCDDTYARAYPESYAPILYSVPSGQRVRLYEQSQGGERNWAMIEAAEWIPLSSLCIYEK